MKKSYFPTITVEGQYQKGGRSWTSNYGYNLGGYLNFPTVNGMLIKNEIKEAKALKIPVFAITDTNVDPTGIDYVIPANDDSIKATKLILSYFVEAIKEGKK